MNRTWIEVLLNILFWLLTAYLIVSGFSIESQEISVENGVETVVVIRNNEIVDKLLLIILFSVLSFYASLKNILRLSNPFNKLSIWLTGVGILIMPLLLYFLVEKYILTSSVRLPTSIVTGLFFFYYTVSLTYGITKVWLKSERQKQLLAFEKKQTELSLLRSQLHPHFLFNVLNNLLSMIDQEGNPMLASSLDRLSALLRYVVYDTANESVTIRKEIEFIKNFIELQKQRFANDEIDIEFNIIGSYDLQCIEPGIFIPFIENVFNYGVEPEKISEIYIFFDLTNPHKIIFKSTNPIHFSLGQNKGKGSGILSTKSRLNLVYPDNHILIITKNETFNVHLEFNTDDSNNS